MEKQYLRIDEVCEAMSFSKATLYRMIRAGGFPAPTKLGERKSRWHIKTLQEWVEQQEQSHLGNTQSLQCVTN